MRRKIKRILGIFLAIHLFPLLLGLIGFLAAVGNPNITHPFWTGFIFGYIADVFVAVIVGFIFLLFWLFD